jgi:hypothetical protein
MAAVNFDLASYWQLLGAFISEFSRSEELVFRLLVKEAGVSDVVAKAIFSGVKIDGAKDFINRLYEARGDERPVALVRAFEQLGVITRMRNDLVHYGVTHAYGLSPRVSNSRTAHAKRALRELHVSNEVLSNMISDLGVINTVILDIVGTHWRGLTWREDVFKAANGAWRYKPSGPSPP